MSKKITLDYIHNWIKDNVFGYQCVSEEYINSSTKLKFICDKGHEFKMSWNSFQKGHRCPICNPSGSESKYTLEIAKDIFKKHDCELLATEYKDRNTLMPYKCQCENISKITLANLQDGHLCMQCGRYKTIKAVTVPFEEVCQCFKDNDCTLLSDESEYKNSKSILRYICSCGNTSTTVFGRFKNGARCIKCMPEKVSQTIFRKTGYKNSAQNPEVQEKMRNTLYRNGTTPCSGQQRYLYNLFGGELNYPVSAFSLDIAFISENLYMEYDGGMHNGRVKTGKLTEDEFRKKEFKRTFFLKSLGWKEIRIISTKDWLPSDIVLLDMLSYARDYLQSHHYIKFDIDNSCIINSQGTFPYDFGKLRRITESDLKNIA